MIQANELRIGNKVLFEGMLLTVKGIKEDEATFVEASAAVEYPDIDPIPLSPDILEACGFEIPHHSRAHRLTIAYEDSNSPCTLQDSGSGIQICRSDIGAICAPVFSLHQLQNLLFALTGTELSINLQQVKG